MEIADSKYLFSCGYAHINIRIESTPQKSVISLLLNGSPPKANATDMRIISVFLTF